jgi:hypothetical protein
MDAMLDAPMNFRPTLWFVPFSSDQLVRFLMIYWMLGRGTAMMASSSFLLAVAFEHNLIAIPLLAIATLGFVSTGCWFLRLACKAMKRAVARASDPHAFLLMGAALQMAGWTSLSGGLFFGFCGFAIEEWLFRLTFLSFAFGVALMSVSDFVVGLVRQSYECKSTIVLRSFWHVFGWILIPAAGVVAMDEAAPLGGELFVASAAIAASVVFVVRFVWLYQMGLVGRELRVSERILSRPPW